MLNRLLPVFDTANALLIIIAVAGLFASAVKVRAMVMEHGSALKRSAETTWQNSGRNGLNGMTVSSSAGEPGSSDTASQDPAVAGGSSAPAAAKSSKSTATSAGGSTSPVSPPASSTSPSSSGHFSTLPPGSALPSDATCASKVRSAPETRAANATANATKGNSANDVYPKVTGNYTGTTDEILQWVACKWGIDEDIVRAQAAKESWWFNRAMGDFTSDTTICSPDHKTLGADGQPGLCPESVGILQVRWYYHQEAFENNNALYSTAYNADYTYAIWRDCYEGNMTWLNTVDKGGVYAAGDEWGCVGEWFSGRWLTAATMPYINAVKDYKNQKVWEKDYFITAQ